MKIKSIVLALAMSIVGAAPAAAANWGGFYGGAHLGYGSGLTKWTYDGTTTPVNHGITGLLGGLQLGYNFDLGRVVLGAEADLDGMNIHGVTSCPNTAFACGSKLTFGGSLRARAGYDFGKFLVYGTGGLAFVRTRADVYIKSDGSHSSHYHKIYRGWTAGAGVEYLLSPSWSVRAEYLYTDYGMKDWIVDGYNESAEVKPRIHSFDIGLNYHF